MKFRVSIVQIQQPGHRVALRILGLCLVAIFAAGCALLGQREVKPDEVRELMQAAQRGDLATVRKLVESGVPVDTKDGAGHTALLKASYNCQGPVLHYLIDSGASVNLIDNYGKSPLLWVLFCDREGGIARRMIESGADLNVYSSSGSIHRWVCMTGSPAVLDYFIEHGMRLDADECFTIAGPSSAALSAHLLDEHTISQTAKDVALSRAVSDGRIEAVRGLMQQGADPTARFAGGETLITIAIRYYSNVETIRLLVDSGADVNARTDAGSTALDIAHYYHKALAITREGEAKYLAFIKLLESLGGETTRRPGEREPIRFQAPD
ncbi:MAG: ankyrin repeat domain-containing protein [bacterium]|nr:ankyrin repeat domain-containing protein [bacterium]